MPRGPRLDAPGALQHVMARGLEKRPIFEDDVDRDDFVRRIVRLAVNGAWAVYAWALMLNHVHLLVRTCGQPLERSMRSLLAGYATRFNRRHDRVGYLFQNRYKSILCEEEEYFLALVRYIHRNPIPSIVANLEELATYPYTGHSALLGTVHREWQASDDVLARFASKRGEARLRYLAFMGAADADATVDLDGGGLVRSVSGWKHVRSLPRGRERFSSDERILGTSKFVDRILREQNEGLRTTRIPDVEDVIDLVCRSIDLDPALLQTTGRSRTMTLARRGIAYLWTIRLRQSGRSLARRLHLSDTGVQNAARAGVRDRSVWDPLFDDNAVLQVEQV